MKEEYLAAFKCPPLDKSIVLEEEEPKETRRQKKAKSIILIDIYHQISIRNVNPITEEVLSSSIQKDRPSTSTRTCTPDRKKEDPVIQKVKAEENSSSSSSSSSSASASCTGSSFCTQESIKTETMFDNKEESKKLLKKENRLFKNP